MSIPLYQIIIDDIISKIESGIYPGGSKLPSEKELTEIYEVSRITSKRALNELEKLNYIIRIQGKGSFVSQVLAQSLEGERILLLIPNQTNFGNYSSGILKLLDHHGINLNIRDTADLSADFIDEIKENYRGVIYYPRTKEEALELSSNLFYQDVPCVLIDKDFSGLPFSSVTSDNTCGTFNASEHLILNGSNNIKFLSSTKIEHLSSVMERFLGFVRAKKEHQMNYDYSQDVILVNEDTNLDLLINTLAHENVDGLVCENDILAIKLINIMNHTQTYIPIVGFDNVEASTMITPNLTTVKQDFGKIGNIAAQLLIEAILDKKAPIQKIKVETELIVRDSSKGDQ